MRNYGVLWHIAVYSWVLLGSTGYWGALVGTKGTGGIARYCWVLRDIETLLSISTPPPSSSQPYLTVSHRNPKYFSITP